MQYNTIALDISLLPKFPKVHKPRRNRGAIILYVLIRTIKYVTLFFANFNPTPSVTLCHTSRDPQKYAVAPRKETSFKKW